MNASASVVSVVPQKTENVFLKVVLGEVFLGFLAIVAAALTVIPMLFKTPPAADRVLEAGQWLIVAIFALEYTLSFSAAHSKKAFLLSPWRIIDLATVVIPLATLVPGVADFLRSSPVLRLVRLARVIALGARASGVVRRQEVAADTAQEHGTMQVRVLPADAESPRPATWDEFVQWSRDPGTAWYSVTNVTRDNLDEVARASGIDREFIANHLLGTNYPHADADEKYLSLFMWVPSLPAGGQVERNRLLLLAGADSVLTFSRKPLHLMERIAGQPADGLENASFPARILCQTIKTVLDANESLVGGFETELREMEELPVRDSRPTFLERTFRLKRELSATQVDLWRVRGALKDLAECRIRLPGKDNAAQPYLKELLDSADYLYETISNTKEALLSLLELHLNVVSFEMNRVMRVLAVVSVLGLIPAVVGGLFGMNLADNPWPLTLPQVSFGVVFAMVTTLYFFVVKGWLR